MRKINLTKKQLQKVVALRQEGKSWLAIEKATGISRRVAQLRYAERERFRLSLNLSEARKELARADLEKHIDLLTRLGATFVAGITLEGSTQIASSAEDKLDGILDTKLLPKGPGAATGPDDRATNRRWTQRLLDALREHTGEEVPWPLIEDWKADWDACRTLLPRFETGVDKVSTRSLKEAPEVREQIEKYADRPGVKAVTEAIRKCPWSLMTKGDENWAEAFTIREGVGNDKNLYELRWGENQVAVFSNKAAAYAALEICRQAMNKIKALPVARRLKAESAKVCDIVTEFEDKLDPLVLRPLLLQTRCLICPA